jgi:hypothetical protein
MEGIQDDTMKLAVEAGFKEADKENTEEILNSRKEKLLNEELIQLVRDRITEKIKMMKVLGLMTKALHW